MSPARSALPLPRYTQRKPLKQQWAYFFNVPSWARKRGCPIRCEALGTDYAEAVKRAETVLLPAFDSWRTGGTSDNLPPLRRAGTLDWLINEYRHSPQHDEVSARQRRNQDSGFKLIADYMLQNNQRLGDQRIADINPGVVDKLYSKLIKSYEADGKGRTHINHAMKACRRAWNVADRIHRGTKTVIPANPFSKMELKSTSRETPTATYDELLTFRAKAKELGLGSLATAAFIAFEFLQREIDIFARFQLEHYRPKERPDAVRVVHHKTEAETWIPLFDSDGNALYPELQAELDECKRDRIGGLMLRRDWGQRQPWPTYPHEGEIDLTLMSRKVKEVVKAAKLRPELTFTSFGHGGHTEAADSDLTDAEIRAQGRHKSAKVLPKYAKRTMKQVAVGQQKRRAQRGTKADVLSE
jgi:hypothetical protein